MHDIVDPFTPATEMAAAIRRRELSPSELTELTLARLDALDPQLNAFCFRADGEVLRAARVATDTVMRAETPEELPPFLGVPMPFKDFVDVAGWPTRYGSVATSRDPVKASDPLVRRFSDAGFIPLGKTTTSEFGGVPYADTEEFGTTRNPWDLERTPGGSSSGSAAAVAAGIAPIAHAADGSGSIRIPASCTGLVGLKATRGRVSHTVVEVEGMGTHGVLTRTVSDTAAALDVLARHDPGAWWSAPTPERSFLSISDSAPPAGLRIGVLLDSPLETPVDAACLAAVREVVRVLEHAGHRIVDTPPAIPPTAELLAAFSPIWSAGAAAFPVADWARAEPHNRAQREAALATDSWAYAEALVKAQLVSRAVAEHFVDTFDVLVTPTMACLPPLITELRPVAERDPHRALVNTYSMGAFTALFSITGQPAISLPVLQDAATGLPVGAQLVAAPWREGLLLQLARELETALPWSDRQPVIS